MKKPTALWTLTLVVSLSCSAVAGEHASRSGQFLNPVLAARMQAPPQASQAKPTTWSSRAEYDAYMAFVKEAPAKLIPLAEAFLQKYPNSFMKNDVEVRLMSAYAQTNDMAKATDTARKLLDSDPDNLDALAFLSYVFPFTFKDSDANKAAELTRAAGDARHGLDVLQKLQKPANVTDAQFEAYVKPKRALFNSTAGFVALQNKDYANAVPNLKAAVADNPSDIYAFYRLGLADLYSTPPDYNNAIWNMARAVALAQANNDPSAGDINNFLKQAYISYHGTDTGLTDIIALAKSSPTPPDGFKVDQMKEPEKTGNNSIDAFNTLTFPLKLGGVTAQKQWDAVKGQPISGLGGTVTSVDKGTDPDTYVLHIAVLPATEAAEGYDIELKDATQPNVKNLQKGDSVLFKGTLDSYVATPTFVLTLVGEVTSDLPDKPPTKPRTPVHRPTHKPE